VPSEIEFHSGLPDKLAFTCRLLRKAYLKGAQVAVTGAPEVLTRLDQALWTFEAQEFVPHVRLTPGSAVSPRLARTPVCLLDPGAQATHREVLVNLGPDPVPGFEAFSRVIEIVSTDPQDRDAGRRRWRSYEAQGLSIKHHAQGTAA
jgi:DNA polymerase III subunit chi